jgi:SulP family sulfate permease
MSGASLADARAFGWVSPLPSEEQPSSLMSSLALYEFDKVEWHLLFDQIPTWLGMFFVVAFSSSLDVAAIEMELGLPLDYNKELQTGQLHTSPY